MRRGLLRRAKSWLAWVLAITVVLTFTPSLAFAEDSSPDSKLTTSKTAEWVDKDSKIAKIQLTVNAANTQVTQNLSTRIVLVVDRSGSMDYYVRGTRETRMEMLKKAASDFVDDTLVQDNGDVQVALVSYNKNVSTDMGFSSSKSALKSSINSWRASGSTNIQAGIHQARGLLDSVQADNEYMIVLTDGLPNYSYYAEDYRAANAEDASYNVKTDVYPDITTQFDYYSYDSDHWLTDISDESNAVSEALMAKRDDKTRMFSIGFGLDDDQTAFMQSLASSDSDAFLTADNLSIVFDSIHSQIVDAGSQGVIHDEMGGESTVTYEYKVDPIQNDSKYPITANYEGSEQGVTTNASYDAANGEMIWNISSSDQGKIKAGKYTLTYYVKIDVNKGLPSVIKTNGDADITYIDPSGNTKTVDFGSPELTMNNYTVEYYYDGVQDAQKTKQIAAVAGQKISSYPDEAIEDYELDRVDWNNDQGAYLEVGSDNSQNIIKVYYKCMNKNVSYKYEGTVPSGAGAVPAAKDYRIGSTVNVEPRPAAIAGYTFEGWTAPAGVTVENGAFKMPGKDVQFTGRWTANDNTGYKVEHYKVDADGGATLAKTDELTGTTDTEVEAQPTTFDGYTYQPGYDNGNNKEIKTGTVAGDGRLVLKLYYTANEDTAYKVEHYKQNLNDSGYTLADTENLTGTTDTEATATPKTYEGFTFNKDAAGTKLSGNIAGDGSLVLKVYYDRNSYDVSYDYGPAPGGASPLPSKTTQKYGAALEVEPAAVAPGYTFSGWSTEDAAVENSKFTMPANDVVFTGSFTANGDTPYKVEHYKQNLDGTYPTSSELTADDIETLTGTTDTTANAVVRNIEGFTHDPNAAGTKLSGNIAGDGSLVLKVFYKRNIKDVSYQYEGSVPAGASALPGKASYKYGEEVNVAAEATAPGYTFSGWSTEDAAIENGKFTMPDNNVIVKGAFTAKGDTPYKVEYYWQNIKDDDYTLHETAKLTGKTDTTANAEIKAYTGFTHNPDAAGTKLTGNIAGDGSLVLKVYYDRNNVNVTYSYDGNVPAGASTLPMTATYRYGDEVTVADNATAPGYTFSGWSTDDAAIENGKFTMPDNDVEIKGSFTANKDTAYKVEHYKQNLNDNGYTLADTENLTGTTDTEATATPKTYEGFTFNKDAAGTKLTGNIAGDGSLVLKVYYDRNNVDVTYSYDGKVPTGASTLPKSATYRYGEEVTVADAATALGYTFSGWSTEDAAIENGKFTMPDNDVEIKGSFTANKDTAYKVEHYKQNVNDDGYTLADTESLTGTTDTEATATPKTYEGFTFNKDAAGTKLTGNIAGDGSLVLKVYYDRNIYKVTFNDYDGKEISSDDYRYGAEVNVPQDPTRESEIIKGTLTDYTFDKWDPEVEKTVVKDAVYKAAYTSEAADVDPYTLKLMALKKLSGQELKEGQFTFVLKNSKGEVIDTARSETPRSTPSASATTGMADILMTSRYTR